MRKQRIERIKKLLVETPKPLRTYSIYVRDPENNTLRLKSCSPINTDRDIVVEIVDDNNSSHEKAEG